MRVEINAGELLRILEGFEVSKIESNCVSCGKRERVARKWCQYDHNGIYHICKKCLVKSKIVKEYGKNGKVS